VEASEDFELAVNPPLNLVCFRHKGGDELNRQLLEKLNSSGKLYLTHTVMDVKFTLRLCVGQTNTVERHVKKAWEEILTVAENLNQPESKN